jgi:hypothetical protein
VRPLLAGVKNIFHILKVKTCQLFLLR